MNIIIPKISPGRQPCANGYILLVSVIIVGAVAASVAVALLSMGAADSRNSVSHQQSSKARAAADTCAEEALEQIRLNAAYSGSAGMSVNGGTCSFTVTNTGGQTRSIKVISSVGAATRRITVTVSAINPIISAAWQETQ